MRGWKAFSLLAALLLGGCIADATPQEDEPGAEETQQGQTQLLEGEELIPAVPAQQTTTTAPTRWNPGTAAATNPGGKPQPDPWRNYTTQGGPNKPQPDPWSPTEAQHTDTQQTNSH